MDTRLEEFRRRAAELGPKRAGRRLPPELMGLASEYSHSRRAEGASWQCIADELGVSILTIRKWAEKNVEASSVFRPVQLVDGRRPTGLAVTLGSLRVEGLSLDDVVTLAKALS